MQKLTKPSLTQKQLFCFYVKIYLPVETSSELLSKTVVPLVKQYVPGVFPGFFYLRYADPKYHIRLRFFGDRGSILGKSRSEILLALKKATQASRAKLVIGRYRPEYRRYGGPEGVRIAERLFLASSQAALAYLSLREQGLQVGKTEFALVSGETLLQGIGLNFNARQDFFPSPKRTEVPADQAGAASIFVKIMSQMGSDPLHYWKPGHPLSPILATLNEEAGNLRRSIALIAKKPGMSLSSLASSYLHMHYNRLFITPQEEKVLRNWRGRAAVPS